MNNVINIFCILSKTGSNKDKFLNDILLDKKFLHKSNIKQLIYGTTRAQREDELDDEEYKFISIKEYKKIDPEDLIEFRSYYTIDQGEVYYFTRKEDFDVKNNLICVSSPYQFEQYRNYCNLENIRAKYNKYRLYAIIIDCSLVNRLENIVKIFKDKDENERLYDTCRRILSEKNEFEEVFKRIPELHHPHVSENVCFVDDNNYTDKNFYQSNLEDIKHFILSKINKK